MVLSAEVEFHRMKISQYDALNRMDEFTTTSLEVGSGKDLELTG
jgi:hypothetical protein